MWNILSLVKPFLFLMCKASVTDYFKALRYAKDFFFQDSESRTMTSNNLIGDDVIVSRV